MYTHLFVDIITIITIIIIIIIIIIMYIYHALINALSAQMIHINLNMIFYTHVEHSPTNTIYPVSTTGIVTVCVCVCVCVCVGGGGVWGCISV